MIDLIASALFASEVLWHRAPSLIHSYEKGIEYNVEGTQLGWNLLVYSADTTLVGINKKSSNIYATFSYRAIACPPGNYLLGDVKARVITNNNKASEWVTIFDTKDDQYKLYGDNYQAATFFVKDTEPGNIVLQIKPNLSCPKMDNNQYL